LNLPQIYGAHTGVVKSRRREGLPEKTIAAGPDETYIYLRKEGAMKILVGYSGPGLDESVLEEAKKHAKAFSGKVYIVTSMEVTDEKQVPAIEEAEKHLRDAKAAVEKDGIPAETHLLVRGVTPGEDLVQFAKDEGVDEVFVGVRKTSRVEKALFGSNAQYVILHAPCPVITVK
jgi:nucleotide-binding universal stress UspA family protein